MTAFANGAPAIARGGSVLSAFLPTPRAPVAPAAAAEPRPRRSLRARLRGRAGQVKDAVVAAAAFTCCDVAAFLWHPWSGWLAVGLSLLLIDHAVDRGEVPNGGAP